MPMDSLVRELFTEICRIPLIDPHSHINPHRPASRTLDDILGYHYYTELAHSVGMDQKPLASDVEPRQRVRTILSYMDRFDNTVSLERLDDKVLSPSLDCIDDHCLLSHCRTHDDYR